MYNYYIHIYMARRTKIRRRRGGSSKSKSRSASKSSSPDLPENTARRVEGLRAWKASIAKQKAYAEDNKTSTTRRKLENAVGPARQKNSRTRGRLQKAIDAGKLLQ